MMGKCCSTNSFFFSAVEILIVIGGNWGYYSRFLVKLCKIP